MISLWPRICFIPIVLFLAFFFRSITLRARAGDDVNSTLDHQVNSYILLVRKVHDWPIIELKSMICL